MEDNIESSIQKKKKNDVVQDELQQQRYEEEEEYGEQGDEIDLIIEENTCRAIRQPPRIGMSSLSSTMSTKNSNKKVECQMISTVQLRQLVPNLQLLPWKLNLMAVSFEHRLLFIAESHILSVFDLDNPQNRIKSIELNNGNATINQIRLGILDGEESVCTVDEGGFLRIIIVRDLDRDPISFYNDGSSSWGVAMCPTKPLVAISSNNFKIVCWDLSSEDPHYNRRTYQGHKHNIPCVDFSPCGRFLVSVSIDKFLRVWDVESQSTLTMLRLSQWGWACRWIDLRSSDQREPSMVPKNDRYKSWFGMTPEQQDEEVEQVQQLQQDQIEQELPPEDDDDDDDQDESDNDQNNNNNGVLLNHVDDNQLNNQQQNNNHDEEFNIYDDETDDEDEDEDDEMLIIDDNDDDVYIQIDEDEDEELEEIEDDLDIQPNMDTYIEDNEDEQLQELPEIEYDDEMEHEELEEIEEEDEPRLSEETLRMLEQFRVNPVDGVKFDLINTKTNRNLQPSHLVFSCFQNLYLSNCTLGDAMIAANPTPTQFPVAQTQIDRLAFLEVIPELSLVIVGSQGPARQVSLLKIKKEKVDDKDNNNNIKQQDDICVLETECILQPPTGGPSVIVGMCVVRNKPSNTNSNDGVPRLPTPVTLNIHILYINGVLSTYQIQPYSPFNP